jgi:hypothetical protein
MKLFSLRAHCANILRNDQGALKGISLRKALRNELPVIARSLRRPFGSQGIQVPPRAVAVKIGR